MIQRIQSVFLALALIIVAVVSSGATIFTYSLPELYYKLNAFGVTQFQGVEQKVTVISSIPFYIAGLLLMICILFSLLMFKNLKRQLSVTRFTTLLYFVLLVFVGLAYFLGTFFTKEENVSVSLGAGFYMLLIGFVLVLLAARGINSDKKLIDSVNRLR